MTIRMVAIPRSPAPSALVEARARRYPDAYPCIVCGLAVPRPKLHVHVIDGGGVALYAADESRYVSDGGDSIL